MASLRNILIRRYVFALILIFIFFAYLSSQDFFSHLVWQKYQWADVALVLNKNDKDLAMQLGRHYFNGGAYDLEKAEQAFEQARSIDPQLLGPRFQLGRIEFIRGNFASALTIANEELALHPEFDRVYYLRGLIHGYAGNLPEAAHDFEEFLKTHKKSWAAHNDLAWIYFRQGEFEKVAETAKKGLEWNPGNPWLLTTYGTALLNLDEKDEAKRILTEALSSAEKLTPKEWGKAYPGNNPEVYASGLRTMMAAIRANLGLAER